MAGQPAPASKVRIESGTPWWGTALVAGLFGLAGVAIAQLVAVRLERARTRREDARRWHAERRGTHEGVKARTGEDSEEFAEFRQTIFEARESFHAAAREELGAST